MSRYQIRGQVRSGANEPVFYELDIEFNDDQTRYWFVIPPEVTESLSNQHQSFVYDIEFRQDDHPFGKPYVRTHVSGTMNIRTDVTHDDEMKGMKRIKTCSFEQKESVKKVSFYG